MLGEKDQYIHSLIQKAVIKHQLLSAIHYPVFRSLKEEIERINIVTELIAS